MQTSEKGKVPFYLVCKILLLLRALVSMVIGRILAEMTKRRQCKLQQAFLVDCTHIYGLTAKLAEPTVHQLVSERSPNGLTMLI